MITVDKIISVDESERISKLLPTPNNESEVTRMLTWVVQTRINHAIIKLLLSGKLSCSFPADSPEPRIAIVGGSKNTDDDLAELILAAL